MVDFKAYLNRNMKIFSLHLQKQKTTVIRDYAMAGNQLSHFLGMNGRPGCTYIYFSCMQFS